MNNVHATLIVMAFFSISTLVLAQSPPRDVLLTELDRNPMRYNNHEITVRGYLRFFREKNQILGVFLYSHQEDVNKDSGDAITIVANRQMILDREKIDGKAVTISGRFRAVPVAGKKEYIGVLKDVQSVRFSSPSL